MSGVSPIEKVFNKLRNLEVSFISTILNIEKIRINLLKNEETIAEKLLDIVKNDKSVILINKKDRKIKRDYILSLLENKKIEEVLSIVHFPSNLLLKISRNAIDKEKYSLLEEITRDEKENIEILTAMHYPMILDIVSLKIRQNPFFFKYENDLINEGFIGIMEAIYKFDLKRDNKFITYATPWVNYRINNFIKNILKELDSQNGNYKQHIFTDKVMDKQYFEDFKDKIYDYDFAVPLAYLFPKLDFDNFSTLKSNFNMILTNYTYLKRILNYCKRDFYEIIMDYQDNPEIAVRLILEKAFSYIYKMKIERKTENMAIPYTMDEQEKIEKENMLKIIFEEATKEEAEILNMFLEEKIRFKKAESVIKKIKERLKKKGII